MQVSTPGTTRSGQGLYPTKVGLVGYPGSNLLTGGVTSA